MNQDFAALPELDFPYRPDSTLDGLIGLEYLECAAELARARLELRPDLLQPMGLLHGGVYACVAESLASMATARAVYPEGKMAMGLSNATSFLRPITAGHLEAVATRLHAGRTTWVWDVECRDAESRRCALTRMTIAVRDAG